MTIFNFYLTVSDGVRARMNIELIVVDIKKIAIKKRLWTRVIKRARQYYP